MRWLPLLLLLGCMAEQDPDDGTFVGNPGKLDVTVVDLHVDIQLDSATVTADSVHLWACDGSDGRYDIDTPFDALATGDAVEIPGGEFCGATLTLDPVLLVQLVGATDAGTTFDVVFDPGDLSIGDTFRVDETELLMALSLFTLQAEELDALGPAAVVRPGDALASVMAEDVARTVELYEDLDADGLVADGDFLLGTYAGDVSQAASADSSGCGCSSFPDPGVGWALGVVFVTILRRRRGERPVH